MPKCSIIAQREEAELLARSSRRLPEDIQQRYDELPAKRDAETLDDEDYAALLQLTQYSVKIRHRKLSGILLNDPLLLGTEPSVGG